MKANAQFPEEEESDGGEFQRQEDHRAQVKRLEESIGATVVSPIYLSEAFTS